MWKITAGDSLVGGSDIPLSHSHFSIFSTKLSMYQQYGQTVKQYAPTTASQNMKQLFLSTNRSA